MLLNLLFLKYIFDFSLKVTSTIFQGRKKIVNFDLPLNQIKNGTVTVRTRLEGISERIDESAFKPQKSIEGKKRVLEEESRELEAKPLTESEPQRNNILTLKRSLAEKVKIKTEKYKLFFSITIKNVKLSKFEHREVVIVIARLLSGLSIGMSLFFLLAYPPGALSIIRLTQLYNLFRLLNVPLPGNLMVFLSQFSLNAVLLAPNPTHYKESLSTCNPGRLYYQAGYFWCSILNSHIPVLLAQFLALLAVKLSLRALLSVFAKFEFRRIDLRSKDDTQLKKIRVGLILGLLLRIDQILAKRLFYYIGFAMEVEVVKEALIALKYSSGDFRSVKEVLNMLIGLIAVVVYESIFMSFGSLYLRVKKEEPKKLSQVDKNQTERSQPFEYSFGEFKHLNQSSFVVLSHTVFTAFYASLSFVVVIASESAEIQLLIIFGIQACFMAFLGFKKPYQDSFGNFWIIFKHFFLFTFALLLGSQIWMEFSQTVSNELIGTALIALLALLMIFEMCYQAVKMVQNLRSPKMSFNNENKVNKLLKLLRRLDLHKEEQEQEQGPAVQNHISTNNQDRGEDIEIPRESYGTGLGLNSKMKKLDSGRKKNGVLSNQFDFRSFDPFARLSEGRVLDLGGRRNQENNTLGSNNNFSTQRI